MNAAGDWQAIAREKMQFFGNVSAAISHEINNRIAVISEKAGLLEDLAGMLAGGKEVDPDRFGGQSRKIVEQVRLARQVTRTFNRFAHSVDVETAAVDAAEILELVVELYARKANMANATILVSRIDRPVTLTTDQFALQTVIGRSLDIALANLDDTGAVTIGTEATDGIVKFSLRGLAKMTGPIEPPDDAMKIPALLEWLGARFDATEDGKTLVLEIPRDQGQRQGRTA
jgi:C4-dicarboxylate-specific signal transduction histidine kinase